jgi:hypothetical protein
MALKNETARNEKRQTSLLSYLAVKRDEIFERQEKK